MALKPDYGQTLVTGDEALALTPQAREILGSPIRRADLHRRLYAPVWTWGGQQRARETNIGIAPNLIATELRATLDNLSHQWEQQVGIDARTLGIATHAALVRIHPFVDGNGRVTRLLADLAFLAAQSGWEPLLAYDWEIDRQAYIRLLREYDTSRDPRELVEFVPVVSIEEASSR